MSRLVNRILALVRIIPSPDPHAVYGFLEDLHLDGRPVLVTKSPSAQYDIYWPTWLKRPVALAFDHLALAWRIVAGALSGRVVIVREFNNHFFLPLLPLAWVFRSRLILNVNENLPQGPGQAYRRVLIGTLARLGVRMMLLDGKEVRGDLEADYPPIRLLTPYFGITDRRRPLPAEPAPDDRAFVVGFVGYFRRDKGGLEALANAIRLLNAEAGIKVALGYWNKPQIDSLPEDVKESVRMTSTHRYDDYSDFIHSCDALVVMAAPTGYNLRHSGILVDALSRGVPAICPNHTLLRFQATAPVPVGVTYADLADLPQAVKSARARRAELRSNFDAYFAARATAAVELELAGDWGRA
jgi:glycosyltransferase involved in cell wall biosynthesis